MRARRQRDGRASGFVIGDRDIRRSRTTGCSGMNTNGPYCRPSFSIVDGRHGQRRGRFGRTLRQWRRCHAATAVKCYVADGPWTPSLGVPSVNRITSSAIGAGPAKVAVNAIWKPYHRFRGPTKWLTLTLSTTAVGSGRASRDLNVVRSLLPRFQRATPRPCRRVNHRIYDPGSSSRGRGARNRPRRPGQTTSHQAELFRNAVAHGSPSPP